MADLELIIAGALALGVLFLFLSAIRYVTSRATRRWLQHEAETVGQWRAEGVEFLREPMGGQFGGLESMKLRVQRGVGFVALTTNELRITRMLPPEVWCINHRQIKGVALKKAFMGKASKKVPFIVVRFVKDAQKDKLGFQVTEYESWAEAIAQAAGVSVKDLRTS